MDLLRCFSESDGRRACNITATLVCQLWAYALATPAHRRLNTTLLLSLPHLYPPLPTCLRAGIALPCLHSPTLFYLPLLAPGEGAPSGLYYFCHLPSIGSRL